MNFKQLCDMKITFPLEVKTGDGIIELSWKPVKYADGYRVFVSPLGENNFVGQVNTESTTVKLRNFKNGMPVELKVKPFRIADGPDNFFAQSEIAATCPLATPQNLRASTDNKGSVFLKWEYNSQCDGFKIYADYSGKGEYIPAAYSSDTLCKIDVTDKKGTAAFAVRAFTMVRHSEKISLMSTPAELEITPYNAITANHTEVKTELADCELRFSGENNTIVNKNDKCTVIIGGDISSDVALQEYAKNYGMSFDFALSSLNSVFASSDFSMAVLDTLIDDQKPYTYEDSNADNCPSAIINTLCKSGPDALVLNHSLYGDFKKLPREFPIPSVLGEKCLFKGKNYSFFDVCGIKIGVVSTVLGGKDKNSMRSLKSMGAEFVFAFCSWREKHSPAVKKVWRDKAKELANNGADFVIGCGLNTIAEYDIIKTKDGREVPVAYSLGCILGSGSITKYETAGAVLCVNLKRDIRNNTVKNAFTGYIPFAFTDFPKIATLLTEQSTAAFGRARYKSYKKLVSSALGSKIELARQEKKNKRLSFELNGSVMVSELFKSLDYITANRSFLFISHFALWGEKQSVDEKYYANSATPLYYNLTKDYKRNIAENKSDCLITDFYYTASTALYEMNGVYYSGGSAFIKSSFYKENRSKLKKLDIKDEAVWKPLMDRYIDAINSVYDSQSIILVKISEPGLYRINGKFVRSEDKFCDLEYLQKLENYFIDKINPHIIDISRFYPGTANSKGKFFAACRDEFYSENVSLIAKFIAEKNYTEYINRFAPVPEIWLSMVCEYFDSIKKDKCEEFFFNLKNAPDYVISKLSKDFISANFEDVLKLKASGFDTFKMINSYFDFGVNTTFKSVYNAIRCIKSGDVSNSAVEEAVKKNLYAKYDLADALAQFFDKNGIIPDCKLSVKNTEFYLKAAQLYSQGSKTAVTKLVKKFYSENRPVTVDIWGREDTQDIFAYSDSFIKGRAVSEASVLTAFTPPADIDLSYISAKSKYYKEFTRAYTKGKAFGDWIIIDLSDILLPLIKHGKSYIAMQSGIENTEIYKQLLSGDKVLAPYKKRSVPQKFIKSCIDSAYAYFSEKYGSNIILRKTAVGYNYINLSGKIKPLAITDADEKNKLLSFAEDYFIKISDCYVLDYDSQFLPVEIGSRQNQTLLGLENLCYESLCNAVESIISGSTDKLHCKIDTLAYIERCENIKKLNPDHQYVVFV